MAITKRGKGKTWSIYFNPLGRGTVWVSAKTSIKTLAADIEHQIMTACKSQSFGFLSPEARAVCISMFHRQGVNIPPDLGTDEPASKVLTLGGAIEICLKDPKVGASSNRIRHEQAFANIEKRWSEHLPVGEITPELIEQYQITRTSEKAAASTVNKERAALSLMFKLLLRKGLVDKNPVSDVKGLSEKDGRREVYISMRTFYALASCLPTWAKPILQTLYFSGMRRGEVLGLDWDDVDLKGRIIRLHSAQTKERKQKRVPIHRLLVPILLNIKRSNPKGSVFLVDGINPPHRDAIKKPWIAACEKIGLTNPRPTIHDLRHTWKTNALRSRMDYEMREAIMGHALGIAGRYGRISDDDLVRTVDSMSFNHGKTEIWVDREYCKNIATESAQKERSA